MMAPFYKLDKKKKKAQKEIHLEREKKCRKIWNILKEICFGSNTTH
jgi:O6-methylguanine-DNA--protein-cysteine methyltransferase